MSKLVAPYVCDCVIGGKKHTNLDIVRLGSKTIDVRLPSGEVVKRHLTKHKVDVKYIVPVVGGSYASK